MNKIKILMFFVTFVTFAQLHGQKTSDEYWDAFGIAMKYYDNADYTNATEAFEVVWTKANGKEMANHRLYAAAANCMIDNEEAVKKNLFKIVDVASTTDMKRVLVNYEIFRKYHDKTWWTELENQMDVRLENLIAHHKNLRIFKKGRNLKYSALRINKNGDTLANTFVTIIPQGTGWGHEAATSQSEGIFMYDYSSQDSLDHILELDSIVHRKFWEGIDTTGVIENDSQVWIHPIRNNEFFKTEIAPFPSVYFPISDSLMQTKKSKTIIMGNWGSYTNTETEENYSYLGKINRSNDFDNNLLCHKFYGTAKNTRHGESTLEYYFNEEYGFTEMNYVTYDGDRIEFKIVEIIDVSRN